MSYMGPKKLKGELKTKCADLIVLFYLSMMLIVGSIIDDNDNDEEVCKDQNSNIHKTPPGATQAQLFIDQLIEHRPTCILHYNDYTARIFEDYFPNTFMNIDIDIGDDDGVDDDHVDTGS